MCELCGLIYGAATTVHFAPKDATRPRGIFSCFSSNSNGFPPFWARASNLLVMDLGASSPMRSHLQLRRNVATALRPPDIATRWKHSRVHALHRRAFDFAESPRNHRP